MTENGSPEAGPAPLTMEESIQEVNDMRAEIDAGGKPDRDRMRRALNGLRAGRSAASRAAGKKAKTPAEPLDMSKLFEGT